jgi:hypothetical protein
VTNQVKKIFLACVLEAIVVVLVALQFNRRFWWVGLVAGPAGYIAYKLIAVLPAALWHAVLRFEAWEPTFQAKVVIGAIVFMLTSIIAGWWLLFLTMVPMISALALATSLCSSIVLLLVVPIAYPIGMPNRSVNNDKEFFAITLVCNPISLTIGLAMGLMAGPFALFFYSLQKGWKAPSVISGS